MNAKRNIIAILLLTLVVGGYWLWSGDRTYPITNAQPGGSTIVALGDSLTAGVGAGVSDAFPEELARRLDVPIINAGVSGDTISQALERLDRDVLDHDPRIVLVLLGGNDILRERDREAAFAQLDTIIRRIHERGALVILMGMRFPMAAAWHRDYEQLARERGCVFIPDVMNGIWGNAELMADRVHPNAAGYRAMADRIEPVLRRYVEQAAPVATP